MEKNCLHCEAHFTAKRESKKYCSDNCKQMAYFKRNGLVLSGIQGVNQIIPKEIIAITPETKRELNIKDTGEKTTVKYEPQNYIVKDVKPKTTLDIKEQSIESTLERFMQTMDQKFNETVEKIKYEFDVKYSKLLAESHFTQQETTIVKYVNPQDQNLPEQKESESVTNQKEIKTPESKHELVRTLELSKDDEEDELENETENEEEDLLYEIKEGEEDQEKEVQEEIKENEINPESKRILELEQEIKELKILLNEKIRQAENTPHETQQFVNAKKETEEKPEPEKEIEQETKYEWIENKLLIRIEKNYDNNKGGIVMRSPERYFDVEDMQRVNWANVRLRCLLESLIRLSNYKSTDQHTLFCVADAFTRIVRSNTYKKLPERYPFKSLLKELCIKLNTITSENRHNEQIVFRLPLERKAQLISLRYEMLNYTPSMKFSEMDFTEIKSISERMEEIVNKSKKSEPKQEKKGWQIRYEAHLKQEKFKNAA